MTTTRTRSIYATVLGIGLALSACAEAAPPGSSLAGERLVDHSAWELVATAAADPFADSRQRPTVPACETGAYWQPMPAVLEVELARCRERYVSLHQGALVGLHAGDRLEFTLSHLLLRPLTEAVTEAYLALTVNGAGVWELVIPIVAPANEYVFSVPVTAEAPVASDVVLHLDNHGENSYTLSPIAVKRGSASP